MTKPRSGSTILCNTPTACHGRNMGEALTFIISYYRYSTPKGVGLWCEFWVYY